MSKQGIRSLIYCLLICGVTSLTRDQAIEVLTAVKDGRIPHTGISY